VKIVIVGAGAVGSYLAQRLSTEGQDVVVIESEDGRAEQSQASLDVLVISGNGASPAILEEAGVGTADLLIAVSNNDGVNLLACHTAHGLGAARTVARVEDPGLREGLTGLNVDVVIDPAESAAEELLHLVRQGGVSELIEFGEGKLILVGGTVQSGSPLAGRTLAKVRAEVTDFDWVGAIIVRHQKTIIAHGETVVLPGDHMLMMVTGGNVDNATDLWGLSTRHVTRTVILGSTHLAEVTAVRLLAEGMNVAMVDPDRSRCRVFASRLNRAMITCGELTDPAVLDSLNLTRSDAVLALSGWDETNILACLLARALGAGTTVTRVNNQALTGLLGDVDIDAVISSRLAAANSILQFVRRGRIHSVATFSDTDAEAIELEVTATSKASGQQVAHLSLPDGVVIGGVLRNGSAMVPRGDTFIEPNDRVILFALPSAIAAVETLFAG